MARPRDYTTERGLTEKWEDRKARRAGKGVETVAPALGRPMAIPPGSDKERQLKRLWKAGTQIKIMAEELGVSEKVIKNARARLELTTRRPDLGKGTQFRITFDSATMKLLRAGAGRRGSTKADYIRYLIKRDAAI